MITLPNFLNAVFTAGLPLLLLSFALVYWAMHKRWLTGDTVEDLQDSIEALSKAQKDKNSRKAMDPALGRWFRFGGGFYGLVAFYTWILIEWEDVAGFLAGVSRMIFNLEAGALIGLVIELVIDSIVNFFLAIAWPAYWLDQARDAWLMFPVAYAGYWLGIKLAQHAWKHNWLQRLVDHFDSR